MERENKKIITKSVNTVRNEYFSTMGGIGNIELLLLLIFIIITVTFSVLIKNLFIFLPIDFLLFVIFTVLIAPAPNTKGKVYTQLTKFFKYFFHTKKRQKVIDLKHALIPFNIKNTKINIFNEKEKIKSYMIVYEICGFDFSLITSLELNDCVNYFANFLKNIDFDIKLIKIEKSFDFTKQTNYINELGSYWETAYKEQTINNVTYKNVFEQLTDRVNTNFSIEEENNFKKMCFYLVFTGENITEIQEKIKLNQDYLRFSHLSLKAVTSKKQLEMIFQKFYLPYANFSNQTLLETINDSQIKFYKNHYKINDTFFSITNILEYPHYVSNGWLINISKLEQTNLIFNLIDLDKSLAIKMLDKGYEKTLMNSFNAKKISQDHDYNNYAESFKELIYKIKNDNEVIKFTQLTFITYAATLEELTIINNKLFTVINQNNITLDKLNYQQKEKLSNLWYGYSKKNKVSFSEMATSSIASCFPFLNNNLIDDKGLYIGQTALGVPCFLDIKLKDRAKRNGHNAFVVGKTGSGKSFNIKKQLNWLFLNKTKIYIIDPEREYTEFVKHYQGKIIDCGNAQTGLINPLQVFHFFDEEIQTLKNENELKSHIRSLEEWFKLIFNTLNNNDVLLAMLEELLFITYKEKHINCKSDLKGIKNEQWPTLQNLYENACIKYQNNLNYNEEQLISYLRQLSSTGSYGELWNGHTTLNVKNDKLIIFDIYNLRKNRQIINAQLYLMLQFLENEIISNKNKNKNLPFDQQDWVCLAVDEAHLLINKQSIIALNFLSELTKRIRKYNGIIYIITQNINDFVGNIEIKRETEAILNNCDYQFVHHLADKDLQDYNSIVQGGLNQDELNAIRTALQGECLLTVGSHKRTFLTIDASAIEEKMWTNSPGVQNEKEN